VIDHVQSDVAQFGGSILVNLNITNCSIILDLIHTILHVVAFFVSFGTLVVIWIASKCVSCLMHYSSHNPRLQVRVLWSSG